MNEILSKIDSAKHIVVISHVNPDADSIGSASAMYTYLLQKHKKVSWYCKTKNIDTKLSFMPWFEKIRNSFPSSADLAISLDCGDIKRVGVELECDLINIDHHESNNNFAALNLVDKSAISTSMVLYDFFKQNNIKINKKMATAIYSGILDDSNAFMDEQVDGTTFAVVRELIECGAEFKTCNKNIVKSMSLAALRLKGVMFTNMTLVGDARVAIFCISDEDMKSTGALGTDCESALEESLYLPHVETAMLVRQNSDFSIKGSIRSNGDVDASKIASVFGGGGHASRAGFNISSDVTLEDAKTEVLNLINKEM
ncbi:MAG: DHH family phosphoesterase [Sulfurimonas sp.]|uniref:DHH family phosphoesterase n=1 Tax=Sulfurimonas sp. TaxID=2022749 RepID=UPI0026352BEE|nr:DHH family phosphoesterase [Sulfurimonas sp.]MCW8894785.1 DHH family phosphoesterase [Sulfurimonas sp.]MCW8953549.1 DHH family phosphoesterase [Sulfurimonas sp.]MCW9067677.1 DHH family phosphoesterase [Sulfurimonas sp.]